MISESIRNRRDHRGRGVVQGSPVSGGDHRAMRVAYHRLPLSFRDVEELMLVRGVIVTYETIRQWCAKFGPVYAAGLRRRQPRPGDTWHLDEVFLTINSRRQYLWRAVDQDGTVLDILVQRRRDAKAAKRFFRKLLKRRCTSPRLLVTSKPLRNVIAWVAATGPLKSATTPQGDNLPAYPIGHRTTTFSK